MNYYNPYYFENPFAFGRVGNGLFSIGSFSFSSLLDGAQKTLGVFNQALPLIKEAAPLMRNAKTMFRVMNEFKKIDNSTTEGVTNNSKFSYKPSSNYGGPTFFA